MNAVSARGRAGGMWIAASAVFVPLAISTALVTGADGSPTASLALVGCGAVIFAARRPWWILPGFIGLTWMSIPAYLYGGLPSPVKAGGLVLVGLAIRQAWRAPERALAPLTIIALIALADVATGLVAVDGPVIPFDALGALSFLLIAALVVPGEDGVERAVIALCAAGVILGLGAAYSVLVHPTALFPLNDQVPGLEADRAAGPFGEPNFFALSLAALVPFSVHLISAGGARRALGVVSASSLIAGVLATGSRGALIAIGLGLAAYVLFAGDRRARFAAGTALVVAIAIAPVFSAQTSSSADRTISGRLTENRISVAMFEDHPVTGVGPGGYPPLYRDYAREIGNDPRILREPHSLPLQIAAEEGVVGLVAWIAAGVLAFAYARRRGLWRMAVGRATILSIITYLAGSLFLHGSQLNLLFILVGLLFALGATRPDPDAERETLLDRELRFLRPA